MPPGGGGGGGGRNHRRRRRMNGASLTGVINSNARTEHEIHSNVRRFFGTLLVIIFLIDIGSALSVVYLSCSSITTGSSSSSSSSDKDDISSNQLHCVKESIFSMSALMLFHHHSNSNSNGTDDNDNLGDFVILAVMRCCFTLVLLWCGIRFGKEETTTTITTRPVVSNNNNNNNNNNNRTADSNNETEIETETVILATTNELIDDLMEPLLGNSNPDVIPLLPDDDETVETANLQPSTICRPCLPSRSSTTTTTTTNSSSGSDSNDPIIVLNCNSQSSSQSSSQLSSSSSPPSVAFWNPKRIKKMILLLVFITCTLYQVYSGLRVATFEDHNNGNNGNNGTDDDHHHHHHHHSSSVWIIMMYIKTILLCSTILWINAEAYIVQVLIVELTRSQQHGLLFLPPEIHRHPLYLETNTQMMSMHWCDLCRQRMSAADNNNNNGNGNGSGSGSGSCYRCSLCDFDICISCSRRNDAAIVGENILRGDSGVRTEQSLTTYDYIKRSIHVAGKSEWKWLITSFILLALSCIFKLFLPHYQGKIIDKVIPIPNTNTNSTTGGGSDSGSDQDSQHYDKKGFIHYIIIYIIIMILQGGISTLYSAIFTLVSRRLKFTIRNALFEKILIQDVAYYDGTESGRLISKLTNDLDLMMSPIQSSLSSLLSNVLILIGGLIMCFIKSYKLSMLAFVCIGPISYLWEQYAIWSKGLAREMLSYWAEGNSIASQALMHIRTVKAFGCEESVLSQYSSTNNMALQCGIKDAWGNGITSALTGYLDLGTGVLILYFGGLLVYRNEMSVGDLVTYQLFWNLMNNSYQNLQGLVTSFTRSAAGAEKVFSLWDSIPDIDPTKGDDITEVDNVRGEIQLNNVSFYYQMRPDNIVLNNFNLHIPAGKTLALVGRSGGGKSTIINLLLRFYDPKQGTILLDGKSYPSMKVHQLRRLFGVVTQETELFALTVEENIAYGMNKENGEYTFNDVVDAAKKAYAHDFICEMKDGYQTRIGERGNRISGGQRQRIAIARVFLRKPKIILLDEATSALDENSQEKVQTALADLIKESNATVIMVAHRLSTVVNADSICVIDKGQVLEQGSHAELVKKTNGIYASMVSKQLAKKVDVLNQDDDDDDDDDQQQSSQEQHQKNNASSKSKSAAAAAASTDSIDALLAD